MKRRPLDRNARPLEPDAQFGEDIVDESLVARFVRQPVHDVAVSNRAVTGSMLGGAFIYGSCAVTVGRTVPGYVVSLHDGVNGVPVNQIRTPAPVAGRGTYPMCGSMSQSDDVG